jgi:hypothetical protein
LDRYIDFIVGDSTVSPPEFQHGYAEKLLLMPFTFQVAHMRCKINGFRINFCIGITMHARIIIVINLYLLHHHIQHRLQATPMSILIRGAAHAMKCKRVSWCGVHHNLIPAFQLQHRRLTAAPQRCGVARRWAATVQLQPSVQAGPAHV